MAPAFLRHASRAPSPYPLSPSLGSRGRGISWTLILDERGEVTAAQGMAELAERLDLDLTDPFPRHGKPPADFLERVLAAVPQAEPQPEDFFLAGAERPQRALDLSRQVLARQGVARGIPSTCPR